MGGAELDPFGLLGAFSLTNDLAASLVLER